MTLLMAPRTKLIETIFSRDASIADTIKRSLGETESSIDAALYNITSERLFRQLLDAAERGVQVRLLTDWSKYRQNPLTRNLLMDSRINHKLSRGRNGPTSKMHHKFLILDQSVVLTGSYNWTLASETQNFENVVLIRDLDSIRTYRSEFDTLWNDAEARFGKE